MFTIGECGCGVEALGLNIVAMKLAPAENLDQRWAFKQEVLQKEDGPLGHVLHFWYRFEYQHRGAIHAHMVLWVKKDTVPPDAVSAEVPRGETNTEFVNTCRDLVKKYQTHNQCSPSRCFKGPAGKVLTSCKYGFPFDINQVILLS